MNTVNGRSNIILAVNPSHSTPKEHVFWEHVATHAKRRGWQLIQIATRALPETRNAISISLPARLAELNRKLYELPISVSEKGWPWVGTDFLHILEDWEHIRWEVKVRSPAVLQGLMRLASFVDMAIKLIRPSIVVTFNKIDPPLALFRLAARYYGISTAVVERSPLDSIWLEPDGLFGESRIWRDYEACRHNLPLEVIALGEREVDEITENPHGFRNDSRSPDKQVNVMRHVNKPVFFLPMDNVLWTGWEQPNHPMRMIDNPLYDTPREGIHDLARKIKDLGGCLIVKKHPACLCIREDILPDDVRLCEGDLGTMIRLSDVVIVFNTKVAFPALATGKPVVTLAPNPIACSGATYHCLQADKVHYTLKKALNKEGLHEKLADFAPFVGWLASSLFYTCDEPASSPAKGPNDFVDDLVSLAPRFVQNLTDVEFRKIEEELRRIAVYKRFTSSIVSNRWDYKKKLVVFLSRLTKRYPSNIVSRILQILICQGPTELVNAIIQKFSPSKSSKVITAQYNAEWGPARKTLDNSSYSYFIKLWCSHPINDEGQRAQGSYPHEVGRLQLLQDKYKGERIFILGTGPSLNNTDLDKLECEYTFGMNRIYLLFNRIQWLPTFYTGLDWRVIPDISEEINKLQNMKFFFPQRFWGLLRTDNNDVDWYGTKCPMASDSPVESRFSYDISEGIFDWGNTTITAIQIAYYLGFDPIYLIGVDADYKVLDTVRQSGPKDLKGVRLYLESTMDDDPNHFDPCYFGKGRKWHNPNIPEMIRGYATCREALKIKGRHLYNATVGGKLEVIERVDFNSIFT